MIERMTWKRTAVTAGISVLGIASATFAFAWNEPTAAPPGNNVAAPINVGTDQQIKNGGLGVNALSVFGNSLFGGSYGSNAYLNFGDTSGVNGYGIRDNAGILEFKNDGGDWDSLQTIVYNLAGSGSQWTTSGNNIYNNNTANVGIGTTSPSGTLGVNASGTGWAGYFSGSAKGIYGQSSAGNAVEGISTGGYGGYFVGNGGAYAKNNLGYYVWLAMPGNAWSVYANGNIFSAGTVQAAVFSNSDIRLKTAVRDLPHEASLPALMKLRPVSFRWKDAKKNAEQGQQMGFIAQEVEKIFPNLVFAGADTTVTLADGTTETVAGTKAVDYSELTVPLVSAVQELKADNDSLRADIRSLKEDNAALKRDIEELRSAIGSGR